MNEKIRNQFPILHQKVHGKQLVYLDNAATTQKPLRVIESISRYYKEYNSNIHRGAHYLAEKATIAYEDAREYIADHINANTQEINFVRGCTEAINLVAYSWGRANIGSGDEILISTLEHHSNIVPWQMLCEEKDAKLKVIDIKPDGSIDMDHYHRLLNENVKLVAVNAISNSLGTINPVKQIVEAAHSFGAKVLIDGAQSAPHQKVDVRSWDCDFYCFSGHKVYGPTGIGILYGKQEIMAEMPPFHGGGEMIKEVSFERTTYNDLPYKFEAGTPNICGAIALNEALKFVNEIGLDTIEAYEKELLRFGTELLNSIDGLQIIGTASNKASVLSFLVDGVHPYDLGVLLDKQGIAVRTGHHCCQPLMDHLNIEGTCRASLAIYNTAEDLQTLQEGIIKAVRMLR